MLKSQHTEGLRDFLKKQIQLFLKKLIRTEVK